MSQMIAQDALVLTWGSRAGLISVKAFPTYLDLAKFAVREMDDETLRRAASFLKRHRSELNKQKASVGRFSKKITN